MFGMQDSMIAAAWILSLVSAAGCVVYGAACWNKTDHAEDDAKQ